MDEFDLYAEVEKLKHYRTFCYVFIVAILIQGIALYNSGLCF